MPVAKRASQRMQPPPPPMGAAGPAFVQPPPPTPGSIAPASFMFPQAQPGAMMSIAPQYDTPMRMPQFNQRILDVAKPDPARYEGLASAAQDAQQFANEASDRYANISDQFMPTNVTAPQPTEMQSFMQNAIKQKIIEAMSGGNDFASRFDRGFDMGQKVAAATVIPLFGALSGGPGAQGFNQATAQIKGEVAQSRQARNQEKNQLNSALINLATLYDTMDPDSVKNTTALLKQSMENRKYNLGLRQQAWQDKKGAMSDRMSAEKNLLDAKKDDRDAEMKALIAEQNYGGKVAQEGQKLQQAAFDNNMKIEANQNQKGYLKIAEDQFANTKAHQAQQQANTEKTQNLAQSKFALEQDNARSAVIKDLTTQYRNYEMAKTKTKADGTLMYPDFGAYMTAGPGLAYTADAMKRLGIEGKPEDFLAGMQEKLAQNAAAKPQGKGADLGKMANDTLNGAKNLLNPASSPKFSIESFKPSEGVLKELQAGKPGSATVMEIRQQLLKATGKEPTAEQIAQYANQLEKIHANKRR